MNPVPAAAPLSQGGVVATDGLSPVPVFLSRAWERFRLHWMSLALIGILAGVGFAVGTAVAAFILLLIGSFSFGAWALGALAALSWYFWVLTWAQAAAMAVALDGSGKLDFLSAYLTTYRQIPAFSWAGLLAVLIALGGFCLFIAPGVALSVFLFFAPFACLAEGATGMESLIRSWGCVHGRWLAVAGRLSLLMVFPWFASLVPFLGKLLGSAAALFALVATGVLYEELRAKTRDFPRYMARRWIWVGVMGFVAFGLAAWRTEALFRDAFPLLAQAYAGRFGFTGTVAH